MLSPTKVILSLFAFTSVSFAQRPLASGVDLVTRQHHSIPEVVERDPVSRFHPQNAIQPALVERMVKPTKTTTPTTIAGVIKVVNATNGYVFGYLSDYGRRSKGDLLYYWSTVIRALKVELHTTKARARSHPFQIGEKGTSTYIGGVIAKDTSSYNLGVLFSTTLPSHSGVQSKMFTLSSNGHLVMHWLEGSKSVEPTLIASTDNPSEFIVEFTTTWSKLYKAAGFPAKKFPRVYLEFLETK